MCCIQGMQPRNSTSESAAFYKKGWPHYENYLMLWSKSGVIMLKWDTFSFTDDQSLNVCTHFPFPELLLSPGYLLQVFTAILWTCIDIKYLDKFLTIWGT